MWSLSLFSFHGGFEGEAIFAGDLCREIYFRFGHLLWISVKLKGFQGESKLSGPKKKADYQRWTGR
jgi:hypothetical protein